ncbi:unnamed protein product [Arctia plantaginis]|uniref:Uncharacterized protein n=1 Tax=Arctia plantaginis TaxID=874455 RepID=A0A8S1B9D1_ARCPL|nr:unnamed protein product [Arctia plantaginis]CAB3255477.1 unnamed protein product [Arctia plantaginis]
MFRELTLCTLFLVIKQGRCIDFGASSDEGHLKYKQNPAPDGHRCGLCPTYMQKICAFDFDTTSTYIFDNHCIMDLFNCRRGTNFQPVGYDKCMYFGNFAYVHGFKYEDMDYNEDNVLVMGSKKNIDFIS